MCSHNKNDFGKCRTEEEVDTRHVTREVGFHLAPVRLDLEDAEPKLTYYRLPRSPRRNSRHVGSQSPRLVGTEHPQADVHSRATLQHPAVFRRRKRSRGAGGAPEAGTVYLEPEARHRDMGGGVTGGGVEEVAEEGRGRGRQRPQNESALYGLLRPSQARGDECTSERSRRRGNERRGAPTWAADVLLQAGVRGLSRVYGLGCVAASVHALLQSC